MVLKKRNLLVCHQLRSLVMRENCTPTDGSEREFHAHGWEVLERIQYFVFIIMRCSWLQICHLNGVRQILWTDPV